MKKNKAFTLIEIMIVVVIVGILATMALPKFLTSSHSGEAMNAVNLLNVLRQEQLAYRIEKGHCANSCDLLEVNLAVPKGFKDLQCNTNDPIVQITKVDDYTLKINRDGSFECLELKNSRCDQVKKVLPHKI